MGWIDKIETQMQSLLSLSNETTGVEDTNLTDAINRLIGGYVYSIDTRENINHVLNSILAASSVEGNSMNFAAANAGDGDSNTRWASKYPSTYDSDSGFDTDPWLKVRFNRLTLIKQINIKLFERNVRPTPSNVQQFSIKYLDMNNNEGYIVQNYKNNTSGSGYNSTITIVLDEVKIVKEIKLCEFIIAGQEWNNIGVVELEAYSNEQTT